MRKTSLLDQAILLKNPHAAIAVSDRLRRIGLNYHDQFDYLKSKYPDLTLPEWDALLNEGEKDSELMNYDIFKRSE